MTWRGLIVISQSLGGGEAQRQPALRHVRSERRAVPEARQASQGAYDES